MGVDEVVRLSNKIVINNGHADELNDYIADQAEFTADTAAKGDRNTEIEALKTTAKTVDGDAKTSHARGKALGYGAIGAAGAGGVAFGVGSYMKGNGDAPGDG